jgi:hypothetical protein
VLGWTESPLPSDQLTTEALIAAHTGRRPARAHRKGKVVLLTSGTTPKRAGSTPGGGAAELKGTWTASLGALMKSP